MKLFCLRHNDWAMQIRDHRKNVINNISLDDDFTQYYNESHTDIPRLREGKVGAQVRKNFKVEKAKVRC